MGLALARTCMKHPQTGTRAIIQVFVITKPMMFFAYGPVIETDHPPSRGHQSPWHFGLHVRSVTVITYLIIFLALNPLQLGLWLKTAGFLL